jgi:DNA polymerase I
MIVEFKNPWIFLFSRDENDTRNIKRIDLEEFRPYFYVKKTEEVPDDPRILRVEETTKRSLFGEELKKIIVREVYDAVRLRNSFGDTYEGDIKFTNRYWIDCVKEVPNENLRKCFFDLETTDMPSVQMDDKPITCIGAWDNYTDTDSTFIVDGKDEVEKREKHNIHHCINEYMMLDKFIDYVAEYDFDMLISHNGMRFDYPVLTGRIQKLAVMNYGRMSPIGVVRRDNSFGEWRCTIGGRILFDFMGAKTNFGIKGGIRGMLDGRDITVKENGEDRIIRIKRWGLAYLAQFVGMEKGKYSAVETTEEMIKYNRQDVRIMVELDKFFNVTNYYQNMQRLIGCSYENTYFNTLMIDNFLLKRYSQFAFPTKPERGKFDNDDTIKGADVTDPMMGLYEKIDVVDQTSLYPTIIVSWGLSPEAVDPNGDIIVGNGVRINSNIQGIIPDAVKFLLDIRLKYKKLAKSETDPHKAQMYDLLSNGYKVLLVSFYGALLYKGFRLYDHSVAESIPYLGRVIKVDHVKPLCEENGYEIIAGDTDSSFLYGKVPKVNINQLIDIINKSFDKFTLDHGIKKHILNIELDKTYSPLLMSDKKKRYVGYLEKNGKRIYKATGFEAVRRDTSPISEVIQEAVFKIILGGGKKKDVELYITSIKDNITSGKIPIDMLILPKGFSKDWEKFKVNSPYVRAGRYSNDQLGTHFDQYSDLGIYYVVGVPEGKKYTDVVAVDFESINLLNGFEIDYDIMFEKTIDSKVQNIFEMLKWEDTVQKTLFEFGKG